MFNIEDAPKAGISSGIPAREADVLRGDLRTCSRRKTFFEHSEIIFGVFLLIVKHFLVTKSRFFVCLLIIKHFLVTQERIFCENTTLKSFCAILPLFNLLLYIF